MIEGLILPEMLSFTRKEGVCLVRTGSLYPLRYARNGHSWRDQEVNVIGHYDKSVKGEVAQDGITFANGFHNSGGDARFLQPQRAGGALIQRGIKKLESFACGFFCGTAISGCAKRGRQRAIEPPSQKNRGILGGPVRKMATIEGHVKNTWWISELSAWLRQWWRTAKNGCPTGCSTINRVEYTQPCIYCIRYLSEINYKSSGENWLKASGAASSNLVRRLRKTKRTVSVGPLRCLAMRSSVSSRSSGVAPALKKCGR